MRINVAQLEQLTLDQFVGRFDESVHARLREQWAKPEVSALVLYRNQLFDSSRYGDQSALSVGPGCSFKSLEDAPHRLGGELASTIKAPIAYCAKE